ncbi:MAG: TerC family protein [Alphaproteobacteria bacterium]|nr:TerC family protein [Alphaproteobacteria bacterium]
MESVEFGQPQFWVALLQIIWINILLSGDNAVVIGLACRHLQARHRLWGIVLGSGVAVALRIIFTGLVAWLMALPYVMLIGGVALFVIAIKLLTDEGEADHSGIEAQKSLWRAARIVAIADLIMSLDNVIAIAAAAKGSLLLLILGITISIPLVVAGASVVTAVLTRLPILVWAGAALLGWIAGGIMLEDPLLKGLNTEHFGIEAASQVELSGAALGAGFVVVAGMAVRRLRRARAQSS